MHGPAHTLTINNRRLPFWGASLTLRDAAALPPYSIVAAVRTHEVAFPRDVWEGVSEAGRDLTAAMLARDPAQRITAPEALRHPWLRQCLGFAPAPSGRERAAEELGNSVDFSDRIAAWHL